MVVRNEGIQVVQKNYIILLSELNESTQGTTYHLSSFPYPETPTTLSLAYKP